MPEAMPIRHTEIRTVVAHLGDAANQAYASLEPLVERLMPLLSFDPSDEPDSQRSRVKAEWRTPLARELAQIDERLRALASYILRIREALEI
jgi:hypothetical protein